MPDRRDLVLRRLKEIQQSDGVTVGHLEELESQASGLEGTARDQPGVETKRIQATRPVVTSAAIEAWRRFERNQTLEENDLAHLEAIVLGNGLRPAFDIQHDSFDNLPSLWSDLNDRRSNLEPLIRGIGRINVTGHPAFTHVGTGFVVGSSCLMTNRHVAEIFTQGVGSGARLSFSPGVVPSVDLKEEVGSSDSILLDVTTPALVLEDWDIAVLQIGALPAGVSPLPLAATAPASISNRMAVVIGYPAMDPNEDLIQQLQIFRSVFDKKRLQPGRLKGIVPAPSFGRNVEALAHDCTTLGGNSGSALIDVDTTKVVGIHFLGQTLVANYAVPAWVLAADARVARAGVEFSA